MSSQLCFNEGLFSRPYNIIHSRTNKQMAWPNMETGGCPYQCGALWARDSRGCGLIGDSLVETQSCAVPFSHHMPRGLTFVVALCLKGLELVNMDPVVDTERVMFKPAFKHTLQRRSFLYLYCSQYVNCVASLCLGVISRRVRLWEKDEQYMKLKEHQITDACMWLSGLGASPTFVLYKGKRLYDSCMDTRSTY